MRGIDAWIFFFLLLISSPFATILLGEEVDLSLIHFDVFNTDSFCLILLRSFLSNRSSPLLFSSLSIVLRFSDFSGLAQRPSLGVVCA
ncbi:hypothetical protein KC347_g280 [Hortaea werneckii]|nr:hypothetical protein KC347_g280 [Hortaea werneckii]